jgi:hypothetical protein
MKLKLAIALWGLALALPAAAQQVATLVGVPVPAGLPKAKLVQMFEASTPQYKAIPRLIRKYYTIGADGTAGGIYLWKDKASADAWYTDAWRADVQKRWGAPAELSWFEVPVLVDNSGGK